MSDNYYNAESLEMEGGSGAPSQKSFLYSRLFTAFFIILTSVQLGLGLYEINDVQEWKKKEQISLAEFALTQHWERPLITDIDIKKNKEVCESGHQIIFSYNFRGMRAIYVHNDT